MTREDTWEAGFEQGLIEGSRRERARIMRIINREWNGSVYPSWHWEDTYKRTIAAIRQAWRKKEEGR